MKKLLKGTLAVTLAGAMCVSFAFAGGNQQDSGAARGTGAAKPALKADGTPYIQVTAGVGADVGDLDPWNVQGSKSDWTLAVFESLMTRESVGGPSKLLLAKSYVKKDNYTYTFTLYDNIHDSNGNHITADDVVYCYDFMKASGRVGKIGYLEKATKIDDYTVELLFNTNAIGIVEEITQKAIVSAKEMRARNNVMAADCVATGPYKVTDYVSGSYIVLEKDANYWQKDRSLSPRPSLANADKVTLKYIASSSQLAIAMQTGEIDGITYLSGSEAARFIDSSGKPLPGYNVKTYLDTNTFQLFINMSDRAPNGRLARSPELRKAFFESIDAKGLLEGILDNRGVIPHSFSNDQYPDYGKTWDSKPYFDYNVQQARADARAAGYNNEPIILATFNASPYKEMAEAIQGYALEAGINVRIYPFDVAQTNTVRNDPTAWDVMLRTTNSPDLVVNCWNYTQQAESYNGVTFNYYKDDKLQQMLQTCVTVDGHTDANMDAFHDYFASTATARGLVAQYFYSIWKDAKTDIYISRSGYNMPTADTYSANWVSVEDR
jgi:ABC-type transport system substrate-binding protein